MIKYSYTTNTSTIIQAATLKEIPQSATHVYIGGSIEYFRSDLELNIKSITADKIDTVKIHAWNCLDLFKTGGGNLQVPNIIFEAYHDGQFPNSRRLLKEDWFGDHGVQNVLIEVHFDKKELYASMGKHELPKNIFFLGEPDEAALRSLAHKNVVILTQPLYLGETDDMKMNIRVDDVDYHGLGKMTDGEWELVAAFNPCGLETADGIMTREQIQKEIKNCEKK